MQEEKFNKQDGNLDQPNVNESLALAGLFRKVSVSERLPKEGKFIFIQENGSLRLCAWDGRKADLDWIKNTSIKYWLEEVELPTDEEVKEQKWIACKNDDGINKPYWDGKEMDGFIKGAKWMRNFVLAGKAVTAKDNVR